MKSPRNAFRLLEATFELYGRYPRLFLILATAVIVPYELIAFALTGVAPLSRSDLSLGATFFLDLTNWALVTPLVSALHVHAVADVRLDREPQIGSVARRGLKVLPVVAAATITATLGMLVGLLALVVPGIILLLRWVVVAQAAAVEHEGWLAALRSSGRLSRGNYGHIAAFLILVGAITTAPFGVRVVFFGADDVSAVVSIAGVGLHVVVASFAALATALLYYDLMARAEAEPAAEPAASIPAPTHLDPRAYGDQDRPKGWYVDPAAPNRMRYWGAAGQPGWIGKARTPRKLRRRWRAEMRSASPPWGEESS